eukprot:m.111089 g.111089  ORF g.111089 m.111089 type:complete len:582 (-) comp12912_c0_seq4:209-1954(-)
MILPQRPLFLVLSVAATAVAQCRSNHLLDANGHLDFPSTTAAVPSLQFKDCTNLRSVTFADSLTEIGTGAFWSTRLMSVQIPDSVRTIAPAAFLEILGLSSVIIGRHVTFIGGGAFGGGNLTSVAIPNRVTFIGDEAFASNAHLQNVYVADSVISMGQKVFQSCPALDTVYLSRQVNLNETVNLFQFTSCPDVFASGVFVCRCAVGSCAPTTAPTLAPSTSPTATPTSHPTTLAPSAQPTTVPSSVPTTSPTAPTASPSAAPTQSTASPTAPTSTPTQTPTAVPTMLPTSVHVVRATAAPRNEYSGSLIAIMVVIPLILICVAAAIVWSLRLCSLQKRWPRGWQISPLPAGKLNPVLISYATDTFHGNGLKEGEKAMKDLVKFLEKDNEVNCYHCNKGITGCLWRPEWFGRIPKTEVAIVMLSPGFYKSRHCLLELHALLDSKVEQDNHIIPVIVEDPEGTDTEEALMAVFKKEGMFPSREEVNVNFLRRFQKKNRLPKNGTYVPARDNVEILRLIHKFTSISEKFDGESAPETEDATDTSDTEDAATPQLNPDLAQSTEATAEVGATSEPASTDVSVSMV